MKLYLTRLACLLSLVITACAHKNQAVNQPPLAPPVDDPPLSKPDNAPKDLPPVVITQPSQSSSDTTASTSQPDQPKPAPKHKKPAAKPASTTSTSASSSTPAPAANAPPSNQQASSGAPEVPAIGQLSSGEPPDLRHQTEDSLNGTEHSLNTLNRKLNDQEEKTATQIREYIKQARAALTTNDLDGAHTLATKARLLLNELTQ
jgi:ATP-dependent exoDNAse (exonuclease V) beta subunit